MPNDHRSSANDPPPRPVLVGVTGHAIGARRDPSVRQSKRLKQFEMMLTAAEYARVFPVVEFSHHLFALPTATFIHAMHDLPFHSIWRVIVTDVAGEERYFLRDEWTRAVATIGQSARASIVLAMDRTCEYSPAATERLIAIADALRPTACLVEVEHHSWIRAAPFFHAAGVGVVQVDAPLLPGIVKQIPHHGKIPHLRALGRNAKHWFDHDPTERFAHTYSREELAGIDDRARELREKSDVVTIVFANQPVSAAIDNATTLSELLGKR